MNVAISSGVAGGDHGEIVPVVLHELDEGVDGLTTEVGSPPRARAYASSIRSMPPSACSITALVFIAVWPT